MTGPTRFQLRSGALGGVATQGFWTPGTPSGTPDPQIPYLALEGDPSTLSAPVASAQPNGATDFIDAAGRVFTFIASGNPAPTYQWEENTGSGWANVTGGSGGTTPNFTAPTATVALDGIQYRCVATNSQGSVTSNAVTWNIIPIRLLTESGSTADASSYNGASITVAVNRLGLVNITSQGVNASDRSAPSSVSIGANALELVSQVNIDTFTVESVWRCLSTSGSISGVLNIAFTGVTQDTVAWSAVEVEGVDTSGTNGSGAVGTASTNSGTGTAMSVGSIADPGAAGRWLYAGWGWDNASTATSRVHREAAGMLKRSESLAIDSTYYSAQAVDAGVKASSVSASLTGSETWGGIAFVLVGVAAAGSHATSGALSADASAISGTAAHLALHPTSGALSAQTAAISGAAQHHHATAGALSAQDSTIAGTATHAISHPTSGALAAQEATVSGAAQHEHATTGALSSQPAALAGTAVHPRTTTGALAAGAAIVAGTAAHEHATTGALGAQEAALAGTADHAVPGATHDTDGALAAQASQIAGTAAHLSLHTTSGALSAQPAQVAGTAEHPHAATGALAAENSTLTGAAAHEHVATGALSAQPAVLSGSADHTAPGGPHSASGSLQAQEATLSGAAERVGTAEADPTDAKFQRPSHNTLIRWQRKQEAQPNEPRKAAPSPLVKALVERVKPRSTGVGEITTVLAPVPPAEIALPEVRVVAAVVPAPKEPPPPLPEDPAPLPVVAAPVPKPPARPKPIVVEMVSVPKAAWDALAADVEGFAKRVAELETQLADTKGQLAKARRAANQAQAQLLALQLLEEE